MKELNLYINEIIQEKLHSKNNLKFKWSEFNTLFFREKISYATNRLILLGEGSSRYTFLLSMGKVLKIAKNDFGLSQNQAEIEMSNTFPNSNLITKIYFYDDVKYEWLVAELVREVKSEKEFEIHSGVPFKLFAKFTDLIVFNNFSFEQVMNYSEFSKLQSNNFLKEIYSMYLDGLDLGDAPTLDHWGITPDRRMVYLDYGLSRL